MVITTQSTSLGTGPGALTTGTVVFVSATLANNVAVTGTYYDLVLAFQSIA
jgi:hypothetical protein